MCACEIQIMSLVSTGNQFAFLLSDGMWKHQPVSFGDSITIVTQKLSLIIMNVTNV